MDANKAFGERLRAAREGSGLTQVQLAGLIDVPQKQISVWEAGLSKPGSLDRLKQLAQAVGATTGWLIDGEGKAPKHVTKLAQDRLARAKKDRQAEGA